MADTEQHTEDTHDPQFEPVIRLTEQVESKTHEEDEEVVFKMYVWRRYGFALPALLFPASFTLASCPPRPLHARPSLETGH